MLKYLCTAVKRAYAPFDVVTFIPGGSCRAFVAGWSAEVNAEVVGMDEVDEPLTVAAGELARALSPGCTLSVDAKGECLTIASEHTSVRLIALAGRENPEWSPPETGWHQMPERFLDALVFTGDSFDATRRDIVRIEVSGTRLRVVSTDGHRLSLADIPFTRGDGMEEFTNVNAAGMLMARAIISRGGGSIETAVEDGCWWARGEGFTVGVSLNHQHRFPTYENLLPDYGEILEFSPREAIQGLRKVKSFADRTGSIKLKLGPEAVFDTTSTDVVSGAVATARIPTEPSKKLFHPYECNINSNYLLSVFQRAQKIGASSIRLSVPNRFTEHRETRPVQISAEVDGMSVREIIMPMAGGRP